MATGYLHADYAESLSEFGQPRQLPESGGWVIQRRIPGHPGRDAMGCYPLFCCRDWTRLHADMDRIGEGLVSVVLVTDPFAPIEHGTLDHAFDVVRPYKCHHVVDIRSDRPENFVSKHHRYYARRALRHLQVIPSSDPAQFVDEWTDLYGHIVRKHGLRGIQAFSRVAFAKQLRIPGAVLFRALSDNKTVGAHFWYVQGDIAYSHLAAFTPAGYELMASYALYWSALDYFSRKVRWLDLGGGAGAHGDSSDGLTRFKQGWATSSRMVYLCGRVFDRMTYATLSSRDPVPERDYFPAYRHGDFVSRSLPEAAP